MAVAVWRAWSPLAYVMGRPDARSERLLLQLQARRDTVASRCQDPRRQHGLSGEGHQHPGLLNRPDAGASRTVAANSASVSGASMIWQATDGDFAPKVRLARRMNGHGRADWVRRDDQAAKRPFGKVAIAVGAGFGATTGRAGCACKRWCRPCSLISIAFGRPNFSTFSENISSPSPRASCGPREAPSRPRSSGEGTLASPACCAAPCHARAQYVRRPHAGRETSAARILLGTSANGWGARHGARRSDGGSSSRCWSSPANSSSLISKFSPRSLTSTSPSTTKPFARSSNRDTRSAR